MFSRVSFSNSSTLSALNHELDDELDATRHDRTDYSLAEKNLNNLNRSSRLSGRLGNQIVKKFPLIKKTFVINLIKIGRRVRIRSFVYLKWKWLSFRRCFYFETTAATTGSLNGRLVSKGREKTTGSAGNRSVGRRNKKDRICA